MKIFTAAQIKALDAFTIREQNITATDLMERAARACCRWIAANYSKQKPVLVLCGMGNNGGGGLALCRLLLNEGFSARAVILKHRETFSDDASGNLTALHHIAPDALQILEPGSFVTGIDENILVIDALFGTGLNRTLDAWTGAFVNEINELPNEVISIDIPSGLPSDVLPEKDAAVIEADHTLSFQLYKRSFMHPESATFTGKIHLLDIGLDEKFIAATHAQYLTIDLQTITGIYKPRQPFAHKGTYGRAQLVGGSYGKIGAITLAGKACARSGAGLVFTHAPACGNNIIQTANPESMFTAAGETFIDTITANELINATGIGPGLGTEPATRKALLQFIETNEKPLVLDADALNLLSENEEHLLKLRQQSILTPHPKEFERLFGAATDSMFQVEIGRAKAMKYNIYIILKGHHTAVLTPSGACWYNTTGNAGMATGGSGDVLTGILTALLAQGYTTQDACLLGVYLHGLAGDIAAKELSQEALIAGDIIDYLGKAFLSLKG